MDKIGKMSDGLRRADHRTNQIPRRRSETMKRIVAALATFVLLGCQQSHAAQKTIEWADGMQCSSTIKFDPKKHDETRLRNTIDVVFTGKFFDFPISDGYVRLGAPGVEAYRNLCARKVEQLSSLPLIDLPGIEEHRRLKIDQLKDWCDFETAQLRGMLGDVTALRQYTPSAPYCSRFVDGLDGTADLKEVWREVVNSHCKLFHTEDACKAEHFAAEGAPDATDRIRRDVLDFGWTSCSTRYVKTGNFVSTQVEAMETKLEVAFRARFRVKRPPCGD
jgi:hypothetical protein